MNSNSRNNWTGAIPRDAQVSHLTGKSLHANTVSASPNEIILPYTTGTSPTFEIHPNSPVTYYRPSQSILSTEDVPVEITFNVDSTFSQLGNILWFFLNSNPASDAAATIHLTPSPSWYYYHCGSLNNNETLDAGARIALSFVYDGEFWINTSSNCNVG